MRLPNDAGRRALVLAALLALAAACFRLPRLGMPGHEYFDEVYHAKTARQYLDGERPVEWVHPPTAKLLIAGGVGLFGYRPWAWRLAPALAGILLAPVFFALARRVLPSERAALLAALLLLCDGVFLVQSRIAMTNIFAVLFQLGAVLLFLGAALEERLPVGRTLAAGALLGLALSTRWTSLWASGFIGLLLLALRRGRLWRPRELALLTLACLGVPALVYTLSYVPWMLITLPDAGWGARFVDMLREQQRVWNYHATLDATHPYFSDWKTWPWLRRPTWYYYDAGAYVRGVVALGHPLLWWASVPVTLWALASGALDRDPRRLFGGLGFCLLYLPWGLSPRTLNYSHYLFEAIPYACLSLGWLLDRHWDDGWRALLARGYFCAVVLLFFFLLPVLTALPIPPDVGLTPWVWFKGWV